MELRFGCLLLKSVIQEASVSRKERHFNQKASNLEKVGLYVQRATPKILLSHELLKGKIERRVVNLSESLRQ